MRLSAVIACYRDAPAVPVMYERLRAAFSEIDSDYEIVFVNDGSPDDAREVLCELAHRDSKVVVVNHTRAFGSQSAFTSGMRIATGEAVILLDGDLQDPPAMIPRFVERWREGFDVVYGVRVEREATAVMRRAYKLFYRAFRRLSYISIPLDAGDFGLLDRRVVDVLNELPESHRFIRGLRAWVGFRQTGVPYVRPERMFGKTTNSLVRNIGWARRAIVSFSYMPLDLIAWLALATVTLSFVGLILQLVLRLIDASLAPKGFTTLIIGMLFIGGVQLLCLAIIGSYVAHIYEESKHRPSFLVESVINAPSSGRPEMRSTRCAICDREGGATERWPATLGIEAFTARAFSARRVPDRIHYRMVTCDDCGLVRSDPVAGDDLLATLYAHSSFDYGSEVESIQTTYGRALGWLEARAPRREALLEIGCGNGFFLQCAQRRGWREVSGVEPSADAVAKAPSGVRGVIVKDVMRPGLFAADSFDAVCLFQVLDHLPDPVAVLEECFTVLRPGGHILALNHNVSAWSARLLGERSPIVDVEHTYLYSPVTMRRLFAKAGFSDLWVGGVRNTYSLAYLAQLVPFPAAIKSRALPSLRSGPAGRMRLTAPIGNLCLIARKPAFAN